MKNDMTLEQLLKGKRLTPVHRRVARLLMSQGAEIGYMSSLELAKLADVSQPSMSRFAVALGFAGFSEMRDHFRAITKQQAATDSPIGATDNKYLAALAAESGNLAALAQTFADEAHVQMLGKLLADSRPLPVLGLRASAGFAHQFAYFAAKVHPDVRALTVGGSLVEDQLEQARDAGARSVLAYAMPLYPRETLRALKYAKELGMTVVAIADSSFQYRNGFVDHTLGGNLYSGLVFDSYAAIAVLTALLLDAFCDAIPDAGKLLELRDKSSSHRKVFERH